jgi:hypothetical protein
MAAKYILAVLAVAFLLAAAGKASRHSAGHPQVRTWALVGVIFGIVSGWLFSRS